MQTQEELSTKATWYSTYFEIAVVFSIFSYGYVESGIFAYTVIFITGSLVLGFIGFMIMIYNNLSPHLRSAIINIVFSMYIYLDCFMIISHFHEGISLWADIILAAVCGTIIFFAAIGIFNILFRFAKRMKKTGERIHTGNKNK